MAKIPPSVLQSPLRGLGLLSRGKVRDTYVSSGHPDKLIVVASDRISIFDFVLSALVPQKGAVLTALNHFWRTQVMGDLFESDLVAAGSGIDEYLESDLTSSELRGNVDLQSRTTVVDKLDMFPVEAIVRGCLTGSSLGPYRADRHVCGHKLPEGLQDGDHLPYLIFAPTTKAEVGHDEHVTADSIAEKYGVAIERLSLKLFDLVQAYALTHGIVLADTKFELGMRNGRIVVGDEVLTPDSSRFWDLEEWKRTQSLDPHESPPGFDKQYVREWGKKVGIKERKPEIAEDVAWVHTQEVPAWVIVRTVQLYRYIFWRLTGQKLEVYQRARMGIDVNQLKVRIEIVTGSESDRSQMQGGLDVLQAAGSNGDVDARRHVISCHRNSEELARFARDLPNDRVVIAGAGKAAALPGVLKALLVKEGKGHIPVIGVAFAGADDRDDLAARLSIEQLPGRPVLLRPDGTAYFGAQGFFDACHAAVTDEFLPAMPSEQKPARLNIPIIDREDDDD